MEDEVKVLTTEECVEALAHLIKDAFTRPLKMPLELETIELSDVIVETRIRKDLGNIDQLAKSIGRFGIIQPLVLSKDEGFEGRPRLVAGGRRLEALRRLGIKQLVHGQHFVWRGEENTYQRKAVELEENLRRTDLSWDEVVLAKKQLLEIQQSIHGTAKMGAPTRAERSGASEAGFGVRKLAEMLGESPSTTSNDLQVAEMITKFPVLRKLPTKQDAMRRLNVAITVHGMQTAAQPKPALGTSPADPGGPAVAPALVPQWRLYHGPFQDNIGQIADTSVDLIATDLPYACGLGDSTAAHGAGLGGFVDSGLDLGVLCELVAQESFRILKDDRYAVFFFGFAYYTELFKAMFNAGFVPDIYPLIWVRDRTAPPSPSRYAKQYDPALVCLKGAPTLLRPNLGNVITIPSVRGTDRLHAAQKPVELMERLILDMTGPGAIVVDIMAGSGTTGVASVKNKRFAIMFEQEKANCSIIEARMKALK